MSPATNSLSSSSSSSRWCPTPVQLMILEEMYRSGTRTPNASQIQQITAHLSFYGKIEGKNVFYWFQNHKARDRQKLRRKLYKQLQQQEVMFHHHHNQHMMMMMNNNHMGYNSPNITTIEPTFSFLTHHHHQQQHSCYDFPSSASSIPYQVQGTRVFEEDQIHAPSSTHSHHNQMMSCPWKMDIPSIGGDNSKKENSMVTRQVYDRDWMSILDDVGPQPNKPLKTLELFPITATNLKEDCTASFEHSHNDCDD